jgi:hypothetical protein
LVANIGLTSAFGRISKQILGLQIVLEFRYWTVKYNKQKASVLFREKL